MKFSRTKEIAAGQAHGACSVLDSYDATNPVKAAQIRFLDILPLDENLAHRTLNVQAGLIDPGFAVKTPRLEIKVAANVKHDSVFLGHIAGSVTSGQQAQEQSESSVTVTDLEIYIAFIPTLVVI